MAVIIAKIIRIPNSAPSNPNALVNELNISANKPDDANVEIKKVITTNPNIALITPSILLLPFLFIV